MRIPKPKGTKAPGEQCSISRLGTASCVEGMRIRVETSRKMNRHWTDHNILLLFSRRSPRIRSLLHKIGETEGDWMETQRFQVAAVEALSCAGAFGYPERPFANAASASLGHLPEKIWILQEFIQEKGKHAIGIDQSSDKTIKRRRNNLVVSEGRPSPVGNLQEYVDDVRLLMLFRSLASMPIDELSH